MNPENKNIILLTSGPEFETLCCDIAKEKYGDYDAQKYGRSGQKQWGVDIKAVDRKSNHSENVVIQCKFRSDPLAFANNAEKEREIIKAELKEELDAALSKHQFNRFVYASNNRRDAILQDWAVTLAAQVNKEIIIWSKDDIDKDILLYPRLTRLYTETGLKNGVEIISNDFIDNLQVNDKIYHPNVFRFYSGNRINYTQWYGILNSWDAPRKSLDKIKERVAGVFSRPYAASKVAALVFGEGGCGKSTLLRRVAIDNVIEKKPYVNWWVERLDVFLQHDKQSIDANPELNHVVFIEDWYRTVDKSQAWKAEDLFKWAAEKTNVCIIIGDRDKRGIYSRYLADKAQTELLPSENREILQHIAATIPGTSSIINDILTRDNLHARVALFMILFVIAGVHEETSESNQFEMRDIENMFRELVAKKIYELENNKSFKGLGKALYYYAKMYSVRENRYPLTEYGFIKIAEHLGDNPSLPDRISENKEFPQQANSFIYRRTGVNRKGKEFSYIFFHHDILAEKGLAYADATKYDSQLAMDDYEFNNLIKVLVKQEERNSALMFWIWYCITNKVDETTFLDKVYEIIGNHFEQIRGGVIEGMARELGPAKEDFAIHILDQPAFFKLPQYLVRLALSLCKDYDYVQQKAKQILEQPNFFKLAGEMLVDAFNICQDKGLKRRKAWQLLEQPEFFERHAGVVILALNILKNDPFSIEKAREIMDQPDFAIRFPEVAIVALNMCSKRPFGKDKAKEVLGKYDISKLPRALVSVLLHICQDEEIGREKAKVLLETPKFVNLPHEILSPALKMFSNEDYGKQKAMKVLEPTDFYELSPELVSLSLDICSDTDFGKQKAKVILDLPDFFKRSFSIVSPALNIWGNDDYGKDKAKEILTRPDFLNLPPELLSPALRILSGDEVGQQAARIVLGKKLNESSFLIFVAIRVLAPSKDAADFTIVSNTLQSIHDAVEQGHASQGIVKLYFDLLGLPLYHFELQRERIEATLENYYFSHRTRVKHNIYKILACYSQNQRPAALNRHIKSVCTNIVTNWRRDMQHQVQTDPDNIFDYHIQYALCYPPIRQLAKQKALEIVTEAAKPANSRIKDTGLFKTAKNIAENDPCLIEWKMPF